MSYKSLASLTVALALASSVAFAADPTLHQVYQAAEAGNYRAAQGMMDQVLHDHPNSAKAHFVEAELLAKQNQLRSAQTELTTAERLEPTLSFAKPEALAELRARINTPRQPSEMATAPPPQPAATSFPWSLVLVGACLLAALMFFLSRRTTPAVVYPANSGGTSGSGWGSGPQPYPAGGMGPVAVPSGGMGSGILGGLATGAAVGAGMVAGEALMHRVLDGGHHNDLAPSLDSDRWDVATPMQTNYDMGGNDFGVNDTSSWDDSSSSGGSDDWS